MCTYESRVGRDVHQQHRIGGLAAAVAAHLELAHLGVGHATAVVVAGDEQVLPDEHRIAAVLLIPRDVGRPQLRHMDARDVVDAAQRAPEVPHVHQQAGRQRCRDHHRRCGREPARASPHGRGR
jgi:hypothetical protein